MCNCGYEGLFGCQTRYIYVTGGKAIIGLCGTQPHRDAYRAATEEHYNLNIDYIYVLAKNWMYLLGANGQSLIVPGAPSQTSL